MNKYEELVYSLIYNCNREITKEEKKILNQASAIYNTYNNLTDELGCPLEVVVRALKEGIIIDRELPKYKVIIGFEENELCLYIEQKFPKWKYKLKDYKKTWWLKEDKSE